MRGNSSETSLSIVILTGAGASKPYGLPTTTEFFRTVGESRILTLATECPLFVQTVVRRLRGKIATLEKVWKDMAGGDKPGEYMKAETVPQLLAGDVDCEEVFSDVLGYAAFLESNSLAWSISRWPAHEAAAPHIDRLNGWVRYMRDTLEQWIHDVFGSPSFPEREGDPYLQLATALWKAGIVDLDMFTTNYDRVVERVYMGDVPGVEGDAFVVMPKGETRPASVPIYLMTGFPVVEGSWDVANYELDPFVATSFDGTVSRSQALRVRYYKLHGSLDWKEREPGGPIISTRSLTRRIGGDVLIYPGFKGELPDRPEIYRKTHDLLRTKLSSAGLLVVIGFQLRDPIIERIVHEAVLTNHALRVIVALPSKPESDSPIDRLWRVKRQHGYSDPVSLATMKFGEPDLIDHIQRAVVALSKGEHGW